MHKCTCRRCGVEFESIWPNSSLCPECKIGHCVICGKEFKRDSNQIKRETCSKKCMVLLKKQNGDYERQVEKAKQTCIEKYGVDNPFKDEGIREKQKKTNLERYGVEYSAQNKKIKEKQSQTNFLRYGSKSPLQNCEVQEKTKETNLQKYGVEHPSQSKEVQEQIEETNLQKYGVRRPLQNKDVQEKMKHTCNEKYGVDYLGQSPEIKDKIKQSVLSKYGVEYVTQSPEVARKNSETQHKKFLETIEDPVDRENYRLFYENPKVYLKNFEEKPTYSELCEKTGVNQSTVYHYITNSNLDCDEFVSKHHSGLENEVVDFLKSLDNTIIIKRCDRQLIKPQEIDIYLPDYKVGIEANSTYVHNSSVPCYNYKESKSKDYHQKKSLACEEKGVFLFHLFEWEWNQKREIIQSMIKNLLGKCDSKYYARNLKVVELDQSTTSDFLNTNHRQGSINSSIRLGLVTKNDEELISVMTFGKMRSGVGKRNDDDEETWELSRFCSKLNTVVVGGASKLFKFFIDHFEPKKIVSFSDIAHTKGNLYQTLGFKKVSITDPGYCYLHYGTDLMLSREQCQKQNLRKLFQDDTIDIENKTEPQIMLEHGFVRMYDSGSIRWEWTQN